MTSQWFFMIGLSANTPALEEVLLDFEDYLRQQKLPLWGNDRTKVKAVRGFSQRENRSYQTYRPYIDESRSEIATNTVICMIHNTNYLLDQQLRALEEEFLKEGGFTERLYRSRTQMRDGGSKR